MNLASCRVQFSSLASLMKRFVRQTSSCALGIVSNSRGYKEGRSGACSLFFQDRTCLLRDVLLTCRKTDRQVCKSWEGMPHCSSTRRLKATKAGRLTWRRGRLTSQNFHASPDYALVPSEPKLALLGATALCSTAPATLRPLYKGLCTKASANADLQCSMYSIVVIVFSTVH